MVLSQSPAAGFAVAMPLDRQAPPIRKPHLPQLRFVLEDV
jgi:hypothetical protein